MKINIFKFNKKFKKGGLHFVPELYWEIIFSIGALVAVASFILGFFLFKEMNKKFVVSTEDVTKELISKERIDKALEYFLIREKKSEEILKAPSPIIDPSR